MRLKLISSFIIFLILSIGISQPIVYGFEFKQQVKLPKEEFEKRIIKYINTPDELKIYLPNLIYDEEDIDSVDFCNVSKEVKDLIPDRKYGDSSKINPPFKNTNMVIFDTVEGISKVDVNDLSGATIKLFDTYQVPRGNYPHALLCAQTAEKLRELVKSNYELRIEGRDPADISQNILYSTEGGSLRYTDLLYVILEGNFRYVGNIDWAGCESKPSGVVGSIDSFSESISKSFYLIKSYGDLARLNGRLHAAGQQMFKNPSSEYVAKHPEYNALVPKNDPRVEYLKSLGPGMDGFEPANALHTAEVRPINSVGMAVPIKNVDVQRDFLRQGFSNEDLQNMFRQRTYEQVVNKVEYASGAAMLVFAIIMLIVNWVYR
jgi:hypothetical protein